MEAAAAEQAAGGVVIVELRKEVACAESELSSLRAEVERLRSQQTGILDTRYLRCDSCGEPVDAMLSSWRSNRGVWEHKCEGSDPQAGHIGTGVSEIET